MRPLVFAVLVLSGALTAILAPAAAAFSSAPAAPLRDALWPPELSGSARLPDGTLILVDDEIRNAVFLWDGDPAHPPRRYAISRLLDDLEGAAADSSGAIYLLTSHSQTRRGRSRPERERLARLVLEPSPRIELAEDLTPLFMDRLGADRRHLSLEGLAWYPRRKALLIGARSPLRGGKAQVLVVGPADCLFDAARTRGSVDSLDLELRTLDLGGRGIRSLTYDPWRRRLWVLAGSVRDESTAARSGYALFLWDFESGAVEPMVAPGFERVAQPEAVEPLGGPDPATRETAIVVAGEGAIPIRLAARPANVPSDDR